MFLVHHFRRSEQVFSRYELAFQLGVPSEEVYLRQHDLNPARTTRNYAVVKERERRMRELITRHHSNSDFVNDTGSWERKRDSALAALGAWIDPA